MEFQVERVYPALVLERLYVGRPPATCRWATKVVMQPDDRHEAKTERLNYAHDRLQSQHRSLCLLKTERPQWVICCRCSRLEIVIR